MSPLMVTCFVVAMEGLALGAVLPVMAGFGRQLGAGEATIGWWVGIWFCVRTAPKVITNPLWGRWSDRLGRRNALLLATAGTMGGSIVWLISGNVWHLLIGQMLGGLFGAQAALAFAVASDTTKPHRRAAAMGMLGAAFGGALTIGPPIGGLIGHFAGLRYVGAFGAAMQLLSLLAIALLLRGRPAADSDDSQPNRPIAPIESPAEVVALIHRPAIRQLLGVCLIITLGYSVLLPTLELAAATWYALEPMQVGYAWGLFGLTGIITQGGLIRPVVRRLGERWTLAVGAAVLAAGFLLLASHPPVVGFWASLAIIGGGLGLASPALTAMLSLAVGDDEHGAVQGLNQGATSLGRGVGYLVGGGLLALTSAGIVYLLAAILAMLTVIMAMVAIATPAATNSATASDAVSPPSSGP